MNTTIQNRLQKLMDDRNMSLSEFADLVGINKGTLSKYLSGAYEPKLQQLRQIATATECDLGWLTGCNDVNPETPAMGRFIRNHRQELGLTQEELGFRCGVNKSAVAKWECGRVTNIDRNTIVKLVSIFGVSVDELLCIQNTQPDGNNAVLTNDAIWVATQYNKLLPEQKELIISMLKQML